ncbi:MAG: peptide ABC transporter substrate-binding protein [Coriobacteriales bacterium]|nr:peptide ABC transporter substrate-binding protein [Coriobacteriales bacterium]MDO5708549.1 peptide ABC transporter substrate-binding protein [Coriobacteriales bacterium]
MSNLTRRDMLRAFGVASATSMLAACGGGNGGNTDGGSADAGAAQSIAVCLSSEPDVIDPALNSAVDGATMIVHLFSGLSKWEKNGDAFVIVPDCATELPEAVDNGDGTSTFTYTLRDGLKWSDGQDLTAKDFEFAMKRASSADLGADYGYLYEIVNGYADNNINVTAVDEKTLQIVVDTVVPYWNELLAFPTFFPVREDVVANEAWCTDPSTYISNGAYTMTGWEHNSVITVEKNPNFIDADSITMDKIEFYLSDDANNMLSNFRNGDWQLIDDVPTNEIAALKEEFPEEFVIAGQIGTYYVGWNVNEEILPAGTTLTGVEAENARAEIRRAIGLLYDRNYICEEIGQAGQVPAASFASMGLTEPDGSEFYKNAGHNDGFDGYYDVSADALESNFASAVETLKKYYTYDEATGMFTDFPTLTYLYNTSEGHKAIGEYLASAMAQVGITMNLENQEWNTFLNTRKSGDYSVARNGWLCDYNDPISMLDMWVSNSGNNDCQFGKGAHKDVAAYSIDLTDLGYDTKVDGGTWAETYDVIIATIKGESDNEKRFALMHKAEDLLMSTGAICPLYFYTDLYMISKSVQGFFSIPLGYKFFHYTTIA